MRLDRWLRDRFPGLSQSQAREIFERGWVRDGRGRALSKGDGVPEAVDVHLWEDRLRELRSGDPALTIAILAEHPSYWIVDKPPAVAGHPLGVDDVHTVTQWAFARDAKVATEFRDPIAIVTPHRLDTGTSGCLVVARTEEAYDRWRSDFAEHAVEKTYLAWTWGVDGANPVVVRHSIGAVPGDPTRRKAVGEGVRGEGIYPAETSLTPIARTKTMTLWEARCQTGVTHQVRVHLTAVGFPLVGDAAYDPSFRERAIQPTHHWLRATKLVAPLGTFQAPTEAFRALPDEELR